MLSSCRTKTQGNPKQSLEKVVFAADGLLILFSRFFFPLYDLNFSSFNLCRFDELTLLEVTMTESRTRCAIRGLVDACFCSQKNDEEKYHDKTQNTCEPVVMHWAAIEMSM